jgi:ArsR family metal-binding transcriptional regulator
LWIMLRTTVELLITAGRNQFDIHPETSSRQGLGATEVFRRLPGTDCQECRYGSCMELAMEITAGRAKLEDCRPIFQDKHSERLSSMKWLLESLCLDR